MNDHKITISIPDHHWRRLVLALFVLGAIGTGTELVLIEHHEDIWQRLPLIALGVGLIAMIGLTIRPSLPVVRGCRIVMLAFVVSGAIGLYQHLTGNMEFERELKPALAGWPLLWASLHGATPALAPGAILHLGLLGWLATLGLPAHNVSGGPSAR